MIKGFSLAIMQQLRVAIFLFIVETAKFLKRSGQGRFNNLSRGKKFYSNLLTKLLIALKADHFECCTCNSQGITALIHNFFSTQDGLESAYVK